MTRVSRTSLDNTTVGPARILRGMSNSLDDLTLLELRRVVADTERLAGPDAQSTTILRRVLERREREERDAPRPAPAQGDAK